MALVRRIWQDAPTRLIRIIQQVSLSDCMPHPNLSSALGALTPVLQASTSRQLNSQVEGTTLLNHKLRVGCLTRRLQALFDALLVCAIAADVIFVVVQGYSLHRSRSGFKRCAMYERAERFAEILFHSQDRLCD